MQRFVLTLSCPDRMGIVAAVGNFLLENRCNIIDSAQFGDAARQRFFMRVCFAAPLDWPSERAVKAFAPIAERFDMQAAIYDLAVKLRVCVMVSKLGHCLNDLLYRYRIGAL